MVKPIRLEHLTPGQTVFIEKPNSFLAKGIIKEFDGNKLTLKDIKTLELQGLKQHFSTVLDLFGVPISQKSFLIDSSITVFA